MLTAIASILGSLVALFGGVRWLLGFYFRQQIKIDAARKTAYAAETKLFKQEADGLKMAIASHHRELATTVDKINAFMKESNDTKMIAEKIYVTLGDFVMESRKKFQINDKVEPVGTVIVKEDEKKDIGKVIMKK